MQPAELRFLTATGVRFVLPFGPEHTLTKKTRFYYWFTKMISLSTAHPSGESIQLILMFDKVCISI